MLATRLIIRASAKYAMKHNAFVEYVSFKPSNNAHEHFNQINPATYNSNMSQVGGTWSGFLVSPRDFPLIDNKKL